MNRLKCLLFVGWAVGLLFVTPVAAEGLRLNISQGTGWVLLNLKDLNKPLRSAGYPTLPEGAQLYGVSTLFPQQDVPWRLGIGGLYWSLRAGETVSLDAAFLGGALDWTVRHVDTVRLSVGTTLGLDLVKLTLRKGRVFDFDDVLNPHRGQRSDIRRWGVWTAPYLKYELSVLESDFLIKVWGGYVWTPWLSGWNQDGMFFDPTSFAGPPNDLSGPYVMVEWSLGI